MDDFLNRIARTFRRITGAKETSDLSTKQRPSLQAIGQRRQQLSRSSLRGLAEEHRKRTLFRDRLNEETIDLLERYIATINNHVMTVLVPQCDPEVRAFTLYKLVSYAICDWKDNGNVTGFDAHDIGDLRSFIQLAMHLSERDGEIEPGVYREVFTALLDDWFDNWNANGHSGPPEQ